MSHNSSLSSTQQYVGHRKDYTPCGLNLEDMSENEKTDTDGGGRSIMSSVDFGVVMVEHTRP